MKKMILFLLVLTSVAFAKEKGRNPATQAGCNVKAQQVAMEIARANGIAVDADGKVQSSYSQNNQFTVTINETFKVFVFTSNSESSCAVETIVVGH